MTNSPQPELPPTSWFAVLGRIAICMAIALGLYTAVSALILAPYIHHGSDAGRVVGVYEGYERIAATTDRGRELVLFWGSSMIREGIDSDQLERADPGVAAYNLAVSGDIPCRRIVELPLVKTLRPDCVVIGVSYPEVFETRTPFEDQIEVLPASAYARMPAEAQALMDSRFREIAGRSAWERFRWQRKFLFSAICWRLGVPDRSNPIPEGYVRNLKAPFVYTRNVQFTELDRFLKQRGGVYQPYTGGKETKPAESISGRSLGLLIRELQQQQTLVVLVNMPLHPLLNAAIPAPRRAALQEYLKSLSSAGVKVFDYQDTLEPECFIDLVHLNASGRKVFTQAMAVLVRTQPAAMMAVTRKAGHEL